MNNQSVILSKDIISGDITPLNSAGNVLLTSRPSLNQLTNVAITTPTNNQILKYDEAGEFWYNGTGGGGGGGASTLAELTDVDITTPANGQYLQYDTSLTPPKWVNKTPSYLSYSLNAYPLNSKFTAQTFFSIFATSTFNETPAPVYNYNFSNGITLSPDTGLITGLDATKSYMIELNMMKNNGTSSSGVHTTSLFTDSPDAIPAGTAIVLNQMWNSSSTSISINLNTILTGQTQICPVLRFGSATYTGIAQIYGFNATINIREL
jgi:hypothetical protein